MGKQFTKEAAVKLTLDALCKASDEFCTVNGKLCHRTHETRGFWLWKTLSCSLGPSGDQYPVSSDGCPYCNIFHGTLDSLREDIVNISQMVVFAHEATEDFLFFDSDDVDLLEWYTGTKEEEETDGD